MLRTSENPPRNTFLAERADAGGRLLVVMQETELGEVTVQENRAVNHRPAAVIGDDEDRSLGRQSVDDLARRCIEPLVDFADRVAKFRRQLRIMDKVILIHVLPEVMLDGVDRHEDEHHHVLRMVLEQVERGFGPLLIHLLHFLEHLLAALVGRHRAEETQIELDLAEVFELTLPVAPADE